MLNVYLKFGDASAYYPQFIPIHLLTMPLFSFQLPYLLFHRTGVNAVEDLINVLDQVDQYPCLYFNSDVIAEAIRRYETLWLPLLLTIPKERARLRLVPPIDVQWVWIVHMLCPRKYITDCHAIYKKYRKAEATKPGNAQTLSSSNRKSSPFDHRLWSSAKRAKLIANAKALWIVKYPNEPFDISDSLSSQPIHAQPHHESIDTSSSSYQSCITYDITAAASRQMAFHYQVAVMPHYKDSVFLRVAYKRYCRFLELKKRNKDAVIVPTYDIDVMWHAHMCHPKKYARDTRHLNVFPHDDTLNDRTDGSQLERQWNVTKTMWHRHFRSAMERRGAMWRGNVSIEERIHREWIQQEVTSIDEKVDKKENTFSVVEMKSDSQSALSSTDTSEYHAVEWVHHTELNQFFREKKY